MDVTSRQVLGKAYLNFNREQPTYYNALDAIKGNNRVSESLDH